MISLFKASPRIVQGIARRSRDACTSVPLLLGLARRPRGRGSAARSRAAALGAMARSGRARHREGPGRTARVERDQERRLVRGDPGARALVSRGLGRPHLPHDGDRGRRGGRRQARQAPDGGPGLPASRRRGRRPQADARGAGARREDGQDPVAKDRLGGHPLRHAPQARQLRLADAGHRRHAGLRVLRVRGPLRLRRSTAR